MQTELPAVAGPVQRQVRPLCGRLRDESRLGDERPLCKEAAEEIERLSAEIDRRFGIGGELIVARRDRDEALHKQRIAEKALERLVRRCESEMVDTIDVPEIQTAKALLGLGA